MRRDLATGLLALALIAGGCSGKKAPFSETGNGELAPTIPRSTTTLATVASPLTGALVSPAVADRPVVIVKVDNSPAARPQAGLNDADVIYEERVEGSIVRFLLLFQSKDATVIGPVRSVRSTDAAIVAPIGGVYAYSGGIKPFVDKVSATGVKVVQESDDPTVGVYKRAGKTRPYATYADSTKLRRQEPRGAEAPPPLFPRIRPGTSFAEANPSATPLASVRIVFGQLTTADWTWDGKKKQWLRSTNGTAHVLEDGTRVSTGCLVLETVPYQPTPYRDRANFVVDEAVITGSGPALIACEGNVVQAKWRKPSLKSVITYTDAVTGAPITLPVGRVWVSLIPTNGEITMNSGAATTTTIAGQ